MPKREFWTGEELRFQGVVKNKNGGLVSKVGCTDFEMIAVSGKVKVPFVFAFVDAIASLSSLVSSLPLPQKPTHLRLSCWLVYRIVDTEMKRRLAAQLLGQSSAGWKLADNSVAIVSVDEIKEALALSIQRVGVIVTS